VILIPEIETVVILVPRTGSRSIWSAVSAVYPRATLLYRHMEADGVPTGYDGWDRVGVVRSPASRLWSLYCYLKNISDDGWQDSSFAEAMKNSVAAPFADWLVNNLAIFATGHDQIGSTREHAQLAVRHALPENRKSQWIYLRPDLGTQIFRHDDIDLLADRLGVTLPHLNVSDSGPLPVLDSVAENYIQRVFRWDIDVCFDDSIGRDAP
jgi:hypothetical protein